VPFVKGQSGNPAGKPKGPNKSTKLAREAITVFIDGNADRLQGWLDEIAQTEGPKAAFQCFTDLIEYSVPKLSRTEHSGIDGEPIQHVSQIRLVDMSQNE
jgi:hypothetical protein